MTGLNGEVVQEYTRALDLLTDCSGMCRQSRERVGADCVDDADLDDDARETIETSARFLYGLIHARYIVTSRGLGKMVRFLSARSQLTCSLRSTAKPTLVVVHEYTATPNPFFPSVYPTFPTRNQSSYIVLAAKTFIHLNQTDMGVSTERISVRHSHICY